MSSLTQEIANLVAASNELTERVDGMLTGIDEHIDERIDAALSQSNLTAIITQVINNLAASGQLGTNALTLGGHPVGDFVLKSDIIDMNPTPASSAVSEVFGATVYTGTGAARTLTTGQDLAQHGGMVHIKSRSSTGSHHLFHSASGVLIGMYTDAANAQASIANTLTAFNNNGFSLGNSPYTNNINHNFVAWTFRNAPKFYGHKVVTKASYSPVAATFPELETLGMARVKQFDGPGDWFVWHRSLPAGQLLLNNKINAAVANSPISVSGTTVTLTNLLPNGQYLVEAWAHDESASGMIQCGIVTPGASGTATVTLGWKPQFNKFKTVKIGGEWEIYDTARTMQMKLSESTSNAENSTNVIRTSATGFTFAGASGESYIYVAIREPS